MQQVASSECNRRYCRSKPQAMALACAVRAGGYWLVLQFTPSGSAGDQPPTLVGDSSSRWQTNVRYISGRLTRRLMFCEAFQRSKILCICFELGKHLESPSWRRGRSRPADTNKMADPSRWTQSLSGPLDALSYVTYCDWQYIVLTTLHDL